MDCIFCKIIDGNIPSYTLYEDDFVKCFLDINPDRNGHCLVIPKKHFKDINDIDELTLSKIFECAKKMKKVLEEKLNIDGLTFIQNNGDVQEVKHFHLHLKPFYNEKQDIKDVKEIYKILNSKN